MKSPRIGCVKYLNARPLIYGWPGEIVLDHPAALCAQLARGDVDVALVSSFEFLRNPTYRIVDNVSISSAGPVYSVVLAHRGDVSAIEEIQLDPAAETSTNLLRIIVSERGLNSHLVWKLNTQSVRPAGSKRAEPRHEDRTSAGRTGSLQDESVRLADKMAAFKTPPQCAQLLIGDQAIRFRQANPDFQLWDLGEEWQKLVDLPFVYALWLVRPEVVEAKVIAHQLRALRDKNLANIDKLIAEEKDFDRDFCACYYRKNLRFNFGKEEKQGLMEFYKRCVKLRLLSRGGLGFGAWDLDLACRCV